MIDYLTMPQYLLIVITSTFYDVTKSVLLMS